MRGLSASIRERAIAHPEVSHVFTGQDLTAAEMGSVPCGFILPDMIIPPHPALAVEKVRFQEDAVAAVVASSRAAAEDAIELIEVELSTAARWPRLSTPNRPPSRMPRLVHDDVPGNKSFTWSVAGGDVEAACAMPIG